MTELGIIPIMALFGKFSNRMRILFNLPHQFCKYIKERFHFLWKNYYFFFFQRGRKSLGYLHNQAQLIFLFHFFHHFVSWVIPFHGFKLFVSFFITSQATNEIFVKYFEIIWIWDKKQNVGSWHFLMIDFSNHCYCSLLYFKYDL